MALKSGPDRQAGIRPDGDQPPKIPEGVHDGQLAAARLSRGRNQHLATVPGHAGARRTCCSEPAVAPGSPARRSPKWAGDTGVAWHRIDPGMPRQNGLTESLNGSLRDACLKEESSDSLTDAGQEPALWRYGFNTVRPQSSLGNKPPPEARLARALPEGPASGALAQPETNHDQPTGLS